MTAAALPRTETDHRLDHQPGGDAANGVRLLLVDDDRLLRGMAVRTLRHAGFEVVEAASGEDALRIAQTDRFDLVLLDVVMDGIDGFETCRRLRAHPVTAQVPVLMMTGLNDTGSIDDAYEAGATDFITKPLLWGLLTHRVRYALRSAAARRELLQHRERLARAQALAHMGSWQLADGGQVLASDEFLRLFGPQAVEAGWAERIDTTDRERVIQARRRALAGAPYLMTFTMLGADGQPRSVCEQAAPVLDAEGRVLHVDGITQDITERAEAERQLLRLASYDSLTGLPNRQRFLELSEGALQRAAQQGGSCAFLHLDIDQFRQVNDALGRDGGDLVLRTVAERLQASTRSADLATYGHGQSPEVVARIGANGFTLLLVDIGHHSNAAAAAQRLIHEVQRPVRVGGSDIVLTASVGIAVYPRDGGAAQVLADNAEQALYVAKRAGRSQHSFFDEGLNAVARERLSHEHALRQAIEEGQLVLHYQPKVDATTGMIDSLEALVRWQHPQRGLVAPGEFIPMAEECGLIHPLTTWVIDAACAALAKWPEHLRCSVNIAASSFKSSELIGLLQQATARHGVRAERLVLEVTESMLLAGADAAIERLHALRSLGFRLSLDDFGTGYSSLSYLTRFPIDELKIDRSFVREIDRGTKDRALVASIITLASMLGVEVVVEGIETQAQASILQSLGCRLHQGFLYARPMPGADLQALLAKGGPIIDR